ncbi:lysophospholipid acyltransferase family protein [Paenibacillus thermoaerophilus]|uniref:Lysophospholipid acyltransferase family protein n=1 Tax=Paenibacillus thermoaerophilus TaxID=1215385 RepID=A0ABW2V754_9BACL|nr:lysophospholipid acyltransferase family protein [Paenibacillus thermoaerophilus]TMV18726.1 1-acyl-sn-glycerol-3-phosphate acyltransferase [Paenibacillus thermoaerophilus]
MLYRFCRKILRIAFRVLYRFETRGLENIPAQGGVVLCSNHISLIDPPLLGTPLNRRIHFMAKEELFKIPLFGRLITALGAYPVKRGGVSKDSIKRSLDLLRQGELIGIFPEGTRKAPTDAAGKRGAATLALKTNAALVPAAIIGNYRPFRKMKLVIGRPIPAEEIAREQPDRGADAVTERLMAEIRRLHSENS